MGVLFQSGRHTSPFKKTAWVSGGRALETARARESYASADDGARNYAEGFDAWILAARSARNRPLRASRAAFTLAPLFLVFLPRAGTSRNGETASWIWVENFSPVRRTARRLFAPAPRYAFRRN